jgi:hypothetical protein
LNLVLPQGATGATGANIELHSTATHLQWRPVGGTTWTNLVALTAITGPQGSTGATGSNIELQTTSTHIQWRVVGGTTWTNLVALTAITGPQGSTGATGPAGPANSLTVGTITTGAAGSSASATITGTAPNQTLNLTIPRGDAGTAGVSWQPVPMSPSATGTAGQIAYDDSFFYVRSADGWRRVAIASWTPLGAPTGVTAAAGNASATVSWTAPASNGGYAITDYAVQFSSDSGDTWTTFSDGTSTTTTATVTGLTNGTAYVFRVAAINAAGTSDYSTATSSVTPAASGIALLLHMDGSNNSTTFTDTSGNGLAVTAQGGAVVSTAQSQFGGASAKFDGTAGSNLQVASSAPLNLGSGDFTIEFWMRLASGYTDRFVAGRTNAALTGGWAVWVLDQNTFATTRKLTFEVIGESFAITTDVDAYADNTWVHIAIVRDGNAVTIYADGDVIGDGTFSGSVASAVGPLFIGGVSGNQTLASNSIDGYIDEFRLSRGIAQYEAAFTPPASSFSDP